MESWLLRCGAWVGRLHPPSRLSAWCFLRWLLVPWTLQLAGKSLSFSVLLLAYIRVTFIQREQLIPRDLSLGICWLRLNIVDFMWEALGN